MTDEQLSAILSAVQSLQLVVQNGFEAVLQGPLSVQASEAVIESEQFQELLQQSTVQQNLIVILICFVALGVGVALGQILARWIK